MWTTILLTNLMWISERCVIIGEKRKTRFVGETLFVPGEIFSDFPFLPLSHVSVVKSYLALILSVKTDTSLETAAWLLFYVQANRWTIHSDYSDLYAIHWQLAALSNDCIVAFFVPCTRFLRDTGN